MNQLILACAVTLVVSAQIVPNRAYHNAPSSGSSTDHPASSKQTSDNQVKHVYELLQSCPSWIRVPPQDTAGRLKIMAIMAEIAECDLDDIRSAIAIPPRDQTNKPWDYPMTLRLLNSVLFEVPSEAGEMQRDSMWPLEYGPKGELILLRSPLGITGFPPGTQQYIRQFDSFRRKYPRRNIDTIRRSSKRKIPVAAGSHTDNLSTGPQRNLRLTSSELQQRTDTRNCDVATAITNYLRFKRWITYSLIISP